MDTGRDSVFDDAEYGGEAADQESAAIQERSLSPEQAAAIVQRLDPGSVQASESDDYMNEVDRRLEVASYYRELLRAPLFENDSPAAQIVEKEVRAHATGRLEVLLAIRPERQAPPPPESQFSPDEVQALKLFLRELIKHPNVLRARPTATSESAPAAPTVRRAQAPNEDRTVRAQQAPAIPVVRKTDVPAAAPAPAKPQPRRGGVAKPVTKPVTLKKTVTGNDGEQHEIEVPRVQRPEGAIPFPPDMSVHTMAASASSVQAAGRGAAALASIATKMGKTE